MSPETSAVTQLLLRGSHMTAGSHHQVWALTPGWMHGVFLILILGGVHGTWKHAQRAGGSLAKS